MTRATPWTPGPWKAAIRKAHRDDPHTLQWIDDEQGNAVIHWAGFDSAPQPPIVKEANARLIAAAPEMAELLRQIASENFGSVWGTVQDLNNFRANARALLARIGAA